MNGVAHVNEVGVINTHHASPHVLMVSESINNNCVLTHDVVLMQDLSLHLQVAALYNIAVN